MSKRVQESAGVIDFSLFCVFCTSVILPFTFSVKTLYSQKLAYCLLIGSRTWISV